MKYMKEFAGRFSAKDFFTMQDAIKFLSEMGASGQYSKLLIHNLTKKQTIFKVLKGTYTFKKDASRLSSAILPSYHGLQEALTIHRIWGQATNQIIITPRKIRSGERIVLGRKAIIRRISRKMFFGLETINYMGEWVNVSDMEKTIIDFAYFNEPLGRQSLKKMVEKIDRKKLEKYLKTVGKRTREKTARLMQRYK